MHVINARNVNDAYYQGLEYLRLHGEPSASRAGLVVVAPCPVTTVYERPQERVLFDAKRDANPFFHMFEALWMLSGSNDARWLDQFVKDFSSRFAEADGIQHGAYGHRWRTAFGFDQLNYTVEKLRKDPTDRQCVLQMWDATPKARCRSGECDPEQVAGHEDLRGVWKDRPCNTHVYFRVRGYAADKWPDGEVITPSDRVLDMTVCCRSNDAIWGAYGANAVHFSVLQEYMAGRIGVGIGRMYQVSNNFHAYVGELDRCQVSTISDRMFHPYNTLDKGADAVALPIGTDWEGWDADLHLFMRRSAFGAEKGWYANRWFADVAEPMYMANFHRHLKHMDDARAAARKVTAADWRMAAEQWFQRRLARAKEKA